MMDGVKSTNSRTEKLMERLSEVSTRLQGATEHLQQIADRQLGGEGIETAAGSGGNIPPQPSTPGKLGRIEDQVTDINVCLGRLERIIGRLEDL